MNLSSKSTYEDILNFKRDEIKAYLKSVNEKVSGSKDELARRAHDYNQKQRGIEQSVLKCDQSDNILAKFDDCKAPSIAELTMGWTSDLNDKTLPPVTGVVQIIGRNSRFIGYFVTKTKKNTEKIPEDSRLTQALSDSILFVSKFKV